MPDLIEITRARARQMLDKRHTPAFREFLRIFNSMKAAADAEEGEGGPATKALREMEYSWLSASLGEDLRESCIKRLRYYVEHQRYPETRIDATEAKGRE